MKYIFSIFISLISFVLSAQLNCEEVIERFNQYHSGITDLNIHELGSQMSQCISLMEDRSSKLKWTQALLKMHLDTQEYSDALIVCDSCMATAGSAYPKQYNDCKNIKQAIYGFSASHNHIGKQVIISDEQGISENIFDASTFDSNQPLPFSSNQYESFLARRLAYPSGKVGQYLDYFKSLAETPNSMIQGPFLLIGYHPEGDTIKEQRVGQKVIEQVVQMSATEMKTKPIEVAQTTEILTGQESYEVATTLDLPNHLNALLGHLKKVYKINNPTSYLAIYLYSSGVSLEGYQEFSDFAKGIHGQGVSGRVGYFNPLDMSVVCWISSGIGTLNHEIVHGLILQDYPTIPGWLYEGFASMYEETAYNFVPKDNYRLMYLTEALNQKKLVTVKELLEASIGQMNGANNELLYAAMARYFVLFLKHNKWLAPLYEDLKICEVNETDEIIQLVIQHTGYDLEELNVHFQNWVKAKKSPQYWAVLQPEIKKYIKQL